MKTISTEQADNLLDKILRFPGPVCTIINLRAAANSKAQKEWTPAFVRLGKFKG